MQRPVSLYLWRSHAHMSAGVCVHGPERGHIHKRHPPQGRRRPPCKNVCQHAIVCIPVRTCACTHTRAHIHRHTRSASAHVCTHAHMLAECARCDAQVHEEEWSYIPVGGPLPHGDQPVTAFGAAANLVHPATGARVAACLGRGWSKWGTASRVRRWTGAPGRSCLSLFLASSMHCV